MRAWCCEEIIMEKKNKKKTPKTLFSSAGSNSRKIVKDLKRPFLSCCDTGKLFFVFTCLFHRQCVKISWKKWDEQSVRGMHVPPHPTQPTHSYIHTRTHEHTNTRTHTHTRTHARTNTHTQTYTHKHTHTHTYTNIHTRTYTNTHAYTQTYTHTHTHRHTHTQTHTDTHAPLFHQPFCNYCYPGNYFQLKNFIKSRC